MTIICKNCNNHFRGNFCNTCGQSADTHRISIHYLWHDIQHGLLHFDKGVLFTAKELLVRPGNAIREFIEGKRVKYFRPVSLVLILAGLYGFLAHYYQLNMLAGNVQITSDSAQQMAALQVALGRASEWFSQHYSLVALGELPVFALGTFIAFRKWGYNFAEHLIISSFLTAQRILLRLILFPLYVAFSGKHALITTERIVVATGTLLMVWSLMQFFNKQKKAKTFLRALVGLFIFVVIAGIITLLIVIKIERDALRQFNNH